MTRYFVALLGIALAASISWNLQTRQKLEAEKTLRSNQDEQIQSLIAQVKSLESKLTQAKQLSASQVGTERSRIADIQAKLVAQQELADRAKQRLEDARSNARVGSDAGSLQEKLRQEKSYMDELQSKLRQVRQQESQIGSQGKTLREQQKWQKHQDLIAMDDKIRQQEVIIQNTVEKLKEYKGRKDYIGQVELQKLQDELKAEKAALSQFKNQKHLLDQQWQNELSLSNNQTQLSQQELKASDEKIRQALQQEQARYPAIQNSLNQSQKSQRAAQDEIKRLEADYEQQTAKVNELKALLKDEQSTLQQLTH
jgi:hypothetical protein